jgi:hypothetical protein
MNLEPGYWRQSETTSSVVRCQQLGGYERCIGGESTGDASCKLGSEGPLCGVCSEGYFAGDAGTCLECDGGGAGISGGVVVILLLCSLAILLCMARWFYTSQVIQSEAGENQKGGRIKFRSRILQWLWERMRELKIKLKIMVVTIQVVSAIPSAVHIAPPSSLHIFFGLFSFLSFNYATIIPFGCSISYDYVDVLLATTIGPIVITVMLYIASEVECALYSEGTERRQDPRIRRRYYQYFLYLTYLVLPSVTTVIFGMFPCQNVDTQEEDQYYLRNDLSISCSSERYTTGVTIAAFMIVVYPFGIPAFYFWQLFLHRDLIRYRSDGNNGGRIADVAAKYGFLYESYEPRFWYWESVEAIRRIVLTGVVSVLSPSSSTQSAAGMILALVYIGLYGQLKPYEDDKDDTLAFVGQYQIFWTFFGTLVIGNDLLGSKQDNTVAAFIIIGNLTVFFLGSFFEISDYRHELGLRSFEDMLGPYLSYIPFSSDLKKRKARKEYAQKEAKKVSLSLSSKSLSLTRLGEEQGVDKPSKVTKIPLFTESQMSESVDQFEVEKNRLREEGLDEATISRGGLLRYLEYASLEKEEFREECREKSKKIDKRLLRVKKRLIKVELHRAETASARNDIEMTENPMRHSIGSEL